MSQARELSLMKKEERFLFRFEPGREEEVLDAFVAMANDRSSNFDWFDAAVLSFQLSKHLVEEADRLLCSSDSPARIDSAGSTTESPWGP